MSEMIYSAFGKNIEDMDRDELLQTLRIAMDMLKMHERALQRALKRPH